MVEFADHVTRKVTLSSNVATSGTFTVAYPDGYDESVFSEQGHKLSVISGADYESPKDFTVAFGADNATVTWNGSLTLTAGTEMYVQFNVKGSDGDIDLRNFQNGAVTRLFAVEINLGAPDAADANGVVASQACTAAGGLATGINGALASGGVATFDVPRNVVASWTTTAVLTVTGTDEDGNVIVESSASGTSLTGKKAFKTVTGISSSADITGLTVGSGVVIGLPVYLPDAAYVIKELEDGAAASAGTIVAGINTASTATTGDVRGTYSPDSAPDGGKHFSLVALLDDPNNRGTAQYAG